MSFEAANPTERPDPTRYLHKREGSPGGLKPAKASPKGSQAGLIPVGRDSPGSPTGSRRQGCSLFRAAYERDSLPVRVDQARPGKNGLRWTADLATLDLHFYLPLFVDGLLETQEPFCMLARRGVEELIAGCEPGRLLPVIPQLIMGLRAALKSPSAQVVQAGLAALNQLVRRCEGAGPALVPFYRQLLPPLARHASDHLSTGDAMDYGHRSSLGELVGATLRTLERAGGPGAAAHIRHFVPDYTSCLAPVWMAHKP